MFDNASCRRCGHPAAGSIAIGMFLAFRLVDHHHKNISRVVNREGGGKAGDVPVFEIAAVGVDFFRSAGLPADHIALGFGKVAGAVGVRDHKPHHRAHGLCRLFREEPLAHRRRRAATMHQGRLDHGAGSACRGDGRGKMKRCHRNAVAIGYRRDRCGPPGARHQRVCHLGNFQRDLVEETELTKVELLPFGADVGCHAGGSDVG